MLRFKRHVEMEEHADKETDKLDQLRSKIRQQRDTRKIISALRDRTHHGAGLNLKALQAQILKSAFSSAFIW